MAWATSRQGLAASGSSISIASVLAASHRNFASACSRLRLDPMSQLVRRPLAGTECGPDLSVMTLAVRGVRIRTRTEEDIGFGDQQEFLPGLSVRVYPIERKGKQQREGGPKARLGLSTGESGTVALGNTGPNSKGESLAGGSATTSPVHRVSATQHAATGGPDRSPKCLDCRSSQSASCVHWLCAPYVAKVQLGTGLGSRLAGSAIDCHFPSQPQLYSWSTIGI